MIRTQLVHSCFAVLFAFFAPRAYADKVVRGPYLQSGTPTNVVLRWRTDLPDTSMVRYGPAVHGLANRTAKHEWTSWVRIMRFESRCGNVVYLPAVQPPSIKKAVPVTNADSSLAR